MPEQDRILGCCKDGGGLLHLEHVVVAVDEHEGLGPGNMVVAGYWYTKASREPQVTL